VYFFSGGKYFRYDVLSETVDPPYVNGVDIAQEWEGLTLDRVDACINWGNGKIFFFRRDQYWQYDIKKDYTDKGHPKRISDRFAGLFEKDIDAAINWSNGIAFFFKGNEYRYFSLSKNKVVFTDSPHLISEDWPGLSGLWNGLSSPGVRAPLMLGYGGVDVLQYPGDPAMDILWNTTSLTWTGFYLAPAPSQGNTSWMNRRAFLEGLGWGFAPIYVGQQTHASPGSHTLTQAQGTIDANDAAALALHAGFVPGSIIYLDIETGPRFLQRSRPIFLHG
jgi:Rv2525c-like, glycoside hydrolase-like domain/Hemopexin